MIFGNTFGENLRITTFGESHGVAIGAVIEGIPPNVAMDVSLIQQELDRRKPSEAITSTSRKENDRIEILSGVFKGKTLGTPVAFIIRNEDARSEDYEHLKNIFRPGHADFSYFKKYGYYDYRGGGRASARETVTRVAAGSIAKQMLKGISITAHAVLTDDTTIEKIKNEGNSIGGIVECTIKNLPAGVGEPVFAKLQALLAMAMMSIPAAKGFEYGCKNPQSMTGSEYNDVFTVSDNDIMPATNNAGGILGGISTGCDVFFRVAFKPIASISKTQKTVDNDGNEIELNIKGRHDISCVPRAVPVVEAMAALVIADLLNY